jgi:hypothetical protein
MRHSTVVPFCVGIALRLTHFTVTSPVLIFGKPSMRYQRSRRLRSNNKTNEVIIQLFYRSPLREVRIKQNTHAVSSIFKTGAIHKITLVSNADYSRELNPVLVCMPSKYRLLRRNILTTCISCSDVQ